MLFTMRDARSRSGSVVITRTPSFPSSSGSHALLSTNSRLRFFSRSTGLIRSARNPSYGTPKKADTASPIAWGFTWNSSMRTSSMSNPFRRAERVASSISSEESTALVTRRMPLAITIERTCTSTVLRLATHTAVHALSANAAAATGSAVVAAGCRPWSFSMPWAWMR